MGKKFLVIFEALGLHDHLSISVVTAEKAFKQITFAGLHEDKHDLLDDWLDLPYRVSLGMSDYLEMRSS